VISTASRELFWLSFEKLEQMIGEKTGSVMIEPVKQAAGPWDAARQQQTAHLSLTAAKQGLTQLLQASSSLSDRCWSLA
jgi:hypothetical protein